MFKKTKLRILTLIMTIATIIITLMLVVIYIFNSNKSFERSISLLESYIDESMFEFHPDNVELSETERFPNKEEPSPDQDFRMGAKEKHNKMFRLSTFYSVLFDNQGNVVKVNSNNGNLYTEQEIIDVASSILQKQKECGKYKGMPFLVRKVKEGTFVALIDNTMEDDNFDRLFKNFLLVGSSTWFVVLILSLVFTNKIVRPLEQNDIRQKQFISDAGHELKTPISVISTNADLLSMEIGDNKWLANIQYENERMGELVKQLLDLMRAENAKQTKEHLDFSRLVSGGTLPFESVAFENGCTLNLNVEEHIMVEGNQNQLSQLISILIDNAICHSSKNGDIVVKLYSDKNHAVFSVVNPGEPIPNEVRTRLFERFYKEDEARTEDAGHYGLGLAIAKAIATAHNGRIELECYDGLVEFKFIMSKIQKINKIQ